MPGADLQLQLYPATRRAAIVKRHNRFVAAVRRLDGAPEDVHVPNSGRLPELMAPGLPCLTVHYGGKRKYPDSLVAVRHNGGWVLVDTQATNRIAGELLNHGLVPGLEGYGEVRSEVVLKPRGHSGSLKGLPRFDFRLDDHPGRPGPVWVEVKSVTLAVGDTALFPDAVTTRGAGHVRELGRLAADGARAAALFLVQRGDPVRFSPNDATDPDFGEALRTAVGQGLEVVVLRLIIDRPPEAAEAPLVVRLDGPLPAKL